MENDGWNVRRNVAGVNKLSQGPMDLAETDCYGQAVTNHHVQWVYSETGPSDKMDECLITFLHHVTWAAGPLVFCYEVHPVRDKSLFKLFLKEFIVL